MKNTTLTTRNVVQAALCVLSTAVLAGFCMALTPSPASAAERVFYIQAIEHKGKTSLSQEPYPATPLANKPGMKMKPTSTEGVWAVEAYGFSPAQLTVVKGISPGLSALNFIVCMVPRVSANVLTPAMVIP